MCYSLKNIPITLGIAVSEKGARTLSEVDDIVTSPFSLHPQVTVIIIMMAFWGVRHQICYQMLSEMLGILPTFCHPQHIPAHTLPVLFPCTEFRTIVSPRSFVYIFCLEWWWGLVWQISTLINLPTFSEWLSALSDIKNIILHKSLSMWMVNPSVWSLCECLHFFPFTTSTSCRYRFFWRRDWIVFQLASNTINCFNFLMAAIECT